MSTSLQTDVMMKKRYSIGLFNRDTSPQNKNTNYFFLTYNIHMQVEACIY